MWVWICRGRKLCRWLAQPLFIFSTTFRCSFKRPTAPPSYGWPAKYYIINNHLICLIQTDYICIILALVECILPNTTWGLCMLSPIYYSGDALGRDYFTANMEEWLQRLNTLLMYIWDASIIVRICAKCHGNWSNSLKWCGFYNPSVCLCFGSMGPLLCAIWALYNRTECCVHILNNKLQTNMFPWAMCFARVVPYHRFCLWFSWTDSQGTAGERKLD